MGGAVSTKGIKLEFYDASGKLDANKRALQFPVGFLTGQYNPTHGTANQIGSDDWLKEVYLAPDNVSLYQLLRDPALQATGFHPPLTSGASQQVIVNYVDENHQHQSAVWTSVVALGTDVKVDINGTDEKLRLIDKLLVTQGDASKPGNGLHGPFIAAKEFLVKFNR